jgi:hypothetical protein
MKRILIYILSVILPCFFVKKFSPENSKTEENDLRGGYNSFTEAIFGLFIKDHAMKVSMSTLVSTSIVNELFDELVATSIESSPMLIATPGHKLSRFSKKVRNILEQQNMAQITEILLNKRISKSDKLLAFKMKIKLISKNLKGSQRK